MGGLTRIECAKLGISHWPQGIGELLLWAIGS